MHETAIAQEILRIVEEAARRGGARKITRIRLVAGEMRAIVPQTLEWCFTFVSEGTMAVGAKIELETIPVRVRCSACKKESQLAEADFRCPACQSQELEVITGMEFMVKDIEVE
ncbi:MAG: hydrogenase maturation nickel metallochaperone HypA [Proteobacteria bacterium]|jgi:hydrogenase nickel incorporation protein HypA/HybF|nr:hydrogenase maturation nickel metallochaperone HypA [Pseudomonadota bacterium]